MSCPCRWWTTHRRKCPTAACWCSSSANRSRPHPFGHRIAPSRSCRAWCCRTGQKKHLRAPPCSPRQQAWCQSRSTCTFHQESRKGKGLPTPAECRPRNLLFGSCKTHLRSSRQCWNCPLPHRHRRTQPWGSRPPTQKQPPPRGREKRGVGRLAWCGWQWRATRCDASPTQALHRRWCA